MHTSDQSKYSEQLSKKQKQMYLLTAGGPFNSTLVVLQLVYKQGFQMNRGGYASAIAMVLFLIIIVVSIMQYYVLRDKEKDK